MTKDIKFPSTDWRSRYFNPENLGNTMDMERVDQLKQILPPGMSLPEMALRFVLSQSCGQYQRGRDAEITTCPRKYCAERLGRTLADSAGGVEAAPLGPQAGPLVRLINDSCLGCRSFAD
jgi:hypothetical protein